MEAGNSSQECLIDNDCPDGGSCHEEVCQYTIDGEGDNGTFKIFGLPLPTSGPLLGLLLILIAICFFLRLRQQKKKKEEKEEKSEKPPITAQISVNVGLMSGTPTIGTPIIGTHLSSTDSSKAMKAMMCENYIGKT
jgi:hypothetical protein